MNNDFRKLYSDSPEFKFLSGLEIDVQYTKIPLLKVEQSGQLIMSVALMAFLMQINCSYLFFAKFDDAEKCENEIRQKILPLLIFQNDPITTPISCLPVIYGINHSEVMLAKQMTLFQIYFMVLHEVGHLHSKHIPGQKPRYTINSVEASKEIEADIFAYGLLEKIDADSQILLWDSIVSLLSFFALAEELKSKLRETGDSSNRRKFADRIYLAKMGLRSVLGKYGPDDIEKDSFEAVEEAANKHMSFAFYPLGVVQQTIMNMSVKELQEFSKNFTKEGMNKIFKEDTNAADKN